VTETRTPAEILTARDPDWKPRFPYKDPNPVVDREHPEKFPTFRPPPILKFEAQDYPKTVDDDMAKTPIKDISQADHDQIRTIWDWTGETNDGKNKLNLRKANPLLKHRIEREKWDRKRREFEDENPDLAREEFRRRENQAYRISRGYSASRSEKRLVPWDGTALASKAEGIEESRRQAIWDVRDFGEKHHWQYNNADKLGKTARLMAHTIASYDNDDDFTREMYAHRFRQGNDLAEWKESPERILFHMGQLVKRVHRRAFDAHEGNIGREYWHKKKGEEIERGIGKWVNKYNTIIAPQWNPEGNPHRDMILQKFQKYKDQGMIFSMDHPQGFTIPVKVKGLDIPDPLMDDYDSEADSS
jgi:hypothetical protein